MKTVAELMRVMPRSGRVEWIGLRPAKHEGMQAVVQAIAETDLGLNGDRYASHGGKRQVTLIQAEHLLAIAAILGEAAVAPDGLRRNVVVSGINLLALKGRAFQIGGAVLEYTGLCHPCSRMETVLGPGGYNAMRGHGGITARVIEAGAIDVGSRVAARE